MGLQGLQPIALRLREEEKKTREKGKTPRKERTIRIHLLSRAGGASIELLRKPKQNRVFHEGHMFFCHGFKSALLMFCYMFCYMFGYMLSRFFLTLVARVQK